MLSFHRIHRNSFRIQPRTKEQPDVLSGNDQLAKFPVMADAAAFIAYREGGRN